MIVALVTFWSLFSAATWLSCNAILPNMIAAGVVAISQAMIVSVCRSHRAAAFFAFQNSFQKRWRCRSISFARATFCKQSLHSFPGRFIDDRFVDSFICPVKMCHVAFVMRIKSSAHRSDDRQHFSPHDCAISSDILCDSIHPRPSCTIPSLGIAQKSISRSALHRD